MKTLSKKIIIYMICGLMTFSVVSTSYYKSVHAMEWVGGALAFEEALKWLMAAIGVTATAGMTDAYWSTYGDDFEDYCTEQNITNQEVTEWQMKLCQGILDKGSECWSAFKSWCQGLISGASGGQADVLSAINGVVGSSFSSISNSDFSFTSACYKQTSQYWDFYFFNGNTFSFSGGKMYFSQAPTLHITVNTSKQIITNSLTNGDSYIWVNDGMNMFFYNITYDTLNSAFHNWTISGNSGGISGSSVSNLSEFSIFFNNTFDTNITFDAGTSGFSNFKSAVIYQNTNSLDSWAVRFFDTSSDVVKLDASGTTSVYPMTSTNGLYRSPNYYTQTIDITDKSAKTVYIVRNNNSSTGFTLGHFNNIYAVGDIVVTPEAEQILNNVFSGDTGGSVADENFQSVTNDVSDLDVISDNGVDEADPEVALPYPGLSDSDNTASKDAYDDIVDAINDGTITIDEGIERIQEIIRVITYDTVTDDVIPVKPDPDTGENKKKDDVIKENKENASFGLNGLQNIFPFCIPFDIYAFMNLLVAEPVAPEFDFPIKSVNGRTEQIHVDLEPFEPVAVVVRYVFDFLFIVGLGLMTRSMIGGGGSD